MNKKPITAFGRAFDTVQELCSHFDISERTFRHRTKKMKLSPEDAIVFGENGRSIAIRGVIYESQKSCAEALNIDHVHIRQVRRQRSCSFNQAVEIILTNREKGLPLEPIALFR